MDGGRESRLGCRSVDTQMGREREGKKEKKRQEKINNKERKKWLSKHDLMRARTIISLLLKRGYTAAQY